MTLQHIDNDTLDLFVKISSTDSALLSTSCMSSKLYNQVLDHLADCEKCRLQVSTISTLQNKWSQIHLQSSLTEDQQQVICDYINGELPGDEAEKVRILITEQPDALKAALHYQTHTAVMQKQLAGHSQNTACQSGSQTEQTTQLNTETFFTKLLRYVRQIYCIRTPMLYTMAVTATLFIAVFVIVLSPQQQQMMVASYQDNPTIEFSARNKLPGIGFFTQSGNVLKPFEDIRIELISNNTIKISWPKIDGAELYKMRLQVFNQGKKTVLKENVTKTNHTTFLLETMAQHSYVNKRYEWVLYGNTADDRVFYASGGFVISKSETENDEDHDS